MNESENAVYTMFSIIILHINTETYSQTQASAIFF